MKRWKLNANYPAILVLRPVSKPNPPADALTLKWPTIFLPLRHFTEVRHPIPPDFLETAIPGLRENLASNNLENYLGPGHVVSHGTFRLASVLGALPVPLYKLTPLRANRDGRFRPLPDLPTSPTRAVQLEIKRNPPLGRRNTFPNEHETRGPVLEFRPAATKTILPVVPALQTVAEEVLPRIETPVTLPGPILPTDYLILLININGEPDDEAKEFEFSTSKSAVLELGRFEARTMSKLVDNFVRVEVAPITVWPLTMLLKLTEAIELARPIPPRALQLIIIILLRSRPLLPRIKPTRPSLPIVLHTALQLSDEILKEGPPTPLGNLRKQPLPLLATAVIAPFRSTIIILMMGPLLALSIPFPIEARVNVNTLAITNIRDNNVPSTPTTTSPERSLHNE